MGSGGSVSVVTPAGRVPLHGSDMPGTTTACVHGILGSPCILCAFARTLAQVEAVQLALHPLGLELPVSDEMAKEFVRPQSVIAAESTPAPASEAA